MNAQLASGAPRLLSPVRATAIFVAVSATVGSVQAQTLQPSMARHSGDGTVAAAPADEAATSEVALLDADFDALLPMYTADARLMPPGAQPVTGAMAVRNFFAGRGRSVSNHKLELVDVSLIGTHAYVTSTSLLHT